MKEAASNLLQKIRAELKGATGLPEGARVLVAWSGGPDSTALAWCMAELQKEGRVQAVAAHINHGMRQESAGEALIVGKMAREMGLQLKIRELDMKPGPGAPARARKARYEALHGIAKEEGCTFVLTAHTLDDQLETLLMRLLRGAGLRGMRGILKHTTEGLYRPMLSVRRFEVLALVEDCGLPAVTDPTNFDPKYLRSRVRHSLLPQLIESSPGIEERLQVLPEKASQLWMQVEEKLEEIRPRRALAIKTLQALPQWAHGAALERWLETPLDQAQVARILRLCVTQRPLRQSAPGAKTIHRVGPFLISGPRVGNPDVARAFAHIIPNDDELRKWPQSKDEGDWRVAGPFMNKKLKDQMRRLGLPAEIRALWPVLVKENTSVRPMGFLEQDLASGMLESLDLFQCSTPYSLLGEEGWI